MRLEHRAACVVGDEADLAAAAVHLRSHRGGEADRVLDGGVLTVTKVHSAVEVEQDPQVGGQRLLEGLGHQSLVLGRQRPVDAAEAVAGGVVAHASCLGRVVGPGAKRLRAADLL